MMENEALDLGKSPQWKPVIRAIESGRPAPDIAARLVEALGKTLKRLTNQLPLGRFLEAGVAQNHLELRTLLRQHNHEYAWLLFEVAQGTEGNRRVEIAEAFLWRIASKALDRFVVQGTVATQGGGFLSFHTLRDQIQYLATEGLRALAQQLADNPDVAPRIPPGFARPAEKVTEEMLGESML